MGMYDDIVCRYPLPTTPPAFCAHPEHHYQSKSLGCEMATYEITEDGRLKQTQGMFGALDEPELISLNGAVEFYDGNCVTGYLGMSFTASGEDYEWVAYEAVFIQGLLKQIVETERKRETALSRADLAECEAMFDKDGPDADTSEPEVGANLYLQWGGSAKGYPVTLIAKTSREYIVAEENGTTDKLHNGDIGRLLFHSQEESDRSKAWGTKAFENKMAYARNMLEQKIQRTNAGTGSTQNQVVLILST